MKAGATFRPPWNAAVSRALALSLWPIFEGFLNGPVPPATCRDCRDTWQWLRRDLDNLLSWRPGELVKHRRLGAHVPLSLELVDGERWEATLDLTRPRRKTCDSLAPDFADLFAVLVHHGEVRPILHRCAQCSRYILRPRSARRGSGRSFCGAPCRREWTRSPAGREANRRRQRAHRRAYPGRTRT